MKSSMFITYPTRSLLRGGQRTILAIICVTVGVMAIVALQLAGYMLQQSLSTNARVANGGDIAITAQGAPFKASDLVFFDNLKNNGTITNYTAITQVNATLNNADSSVKSFNLEAIDPNNFPLLSQPAFVQPGNGTLAQILVNNQVVVTQNFLATYNKRIGDTFNVYVKTSLGSGQTLSVKIAGVIANTGTFAQAGNLLLISSRGYLANAPAGLANYTLVDVTTEDQAHTDAALKAINRQFPLVSTQTATDLLNSEESSTDLISTFLKIAGLISLLIGGVGIINTMQVLLSRRKPEIAMLKTAGYPRRDLALLFAIETGLLGLIGGIIGATSAVGVSYLIRNLMESLGTNVPFVLNPGLLLGGVVVGFTTAMIFGLLPIVQAANVRPLQVLREFESKSISSRVLTMLLLVLFSILFCILAIVILNNNIGLGITVTYSIFAGLLLLGGLFSLITFGLGKLPVPERARFWHVLLVALGIVASVMVYRVLPLMGIFVLIVSLLGLLVVFLPQRGKVNVKMALRNISRRRARTTATLLALFIGVVGIGIDVGFGQDLSTQILNALNQNTPYNLVATTVGRDANTLRAHLGSIPGVSASRADPFATTLPLRIDGQPAQRAMPGGSAGQAALRQLGGIEGYDLAHTLPAQRIIHGRNLTAADANTNNVLVSQIMTSQGWAGMHLKVGDTVTLTSLDGKTMKTVTIVGIISVPTSFETLGEVLGSDSLVDAFNATNTAGSTTVFYMKVAPDKLDQAMNTLNRIVPNAAIQNLTDAGVSFLQNVIGVMDILLAISSLSLLAGLVIIANSVALAMLERRRELGILKSVGYTSGTILSQIVIENGIIGGVGAFVATFIAANQVNLGSAIFFNNNLILNIEPQVIVLMLIGPVVLAILTAILVAWNAVRVRPLMVLKYE